MNFLQVLLKVNKKRKVSVCLSNRRQINLRSQILLLGIMLWVCQGGKAIADNGPFSSCPAPAYISQGSSNNAVKLYSVDLFGGALSPISANNIPDGINGIGFNQLDGYIYGMNTSSTAPKLYRLDKTGVETDLGTVTGLPTGRSYNVGDVDSNGVLYVTAGVSTVIYGIDIANKIVIKTISNSVSGITDFSFHPTNGKLYTIKNNEKKVYEISWPSGADVKATLTDRGIPTGMPTGNTSYGAMFFAIDGSFYGYRNDGKIYRITNVAGTGSPIATFITSSATTVSTNDGARCALAPPIYPPNAVDYGDAPDTSDGTGTGNYKTKALDNGPVHEIIAGLRIGTNVDGDSGSLQNTTATDDDNNVSPDDEDGVASFPPLYTDAGASYSVSAQVTNTTGNPAYLMGYMDFNKDGDFDDANEKSNIVNVPNNPTGNQTVVFNTPAGMTAGKTYARFRLSSTQAQAESSVGIATSGEVEDYQVAITGYDYGDAPTGYENNNSARHVIVSGLHLGNVAPDDEAVAQSSANANGDNAVAAPNVNDEEGISTFPPLKTDTNSYSLTAKVNNPGDSPANVYGWLDFDRDSEFDEDERATVSNGSITLDSNSKVPTGSSGTVTLTWNNIGSTGPNITDGNSFMRVRLTNDNLNLTTETTARDDASIGSATNGEVEDYTIAIAKSLDYGDAPSSYGDAGHEIATTPTIYLGSTKPDQESGTQLGTDNGAAAVGDDNNGIPDDEDAFTTLANVSTIDNYDILVPVKNTSGGSVTLHAWVDFDKDGQFESGEYKATTVANNITRVNLNWQIPSGTSPGDTYIRFRLTTSALTDNSTTVNIDERSIGNATNGEVEDYKVTIEPVPSLPPLSVGSCEVAITNGGFEAPALTTTSPTPYETFVPGKIAAYNENDVPGWTSFADSYIELWRNGNNTSGNPPAYEGEQFAEINAYVNGSLYQDVYTIPGSVITWQFAHRGREGIDTMNLKIGSPGATVAQTNLTTGNTSFQTGNTGWLVYQGTYTVPAGQTTTRFEYKAVSTASSSQSVGNFIDAVSFGPLCDFGDAKSDYPVLKNNNGAAHVNDGVTFLGSKVRIELDGQPSIAADGDDGIVGDTDQIDDEDGVSFTSTLNAGNTASVDVVASVPGYLNAWIDFNQDNDWDDSGEKIFTDRSLTAGTNNLSLPVPANANIGNTFARFRFSTNTGINSTGIVVSGEVEDYKIAIAPDNNRPLGSPFTCSSTFYITTGNGGINPQSLYDVNRSGSTYTFTQRGPSTSVTDGYSNTFSYNALAYNPVDNYLYAFVTDSSATTGPYAVGNVVKIGSDGILRSLGKPTDGSGGTLPITNYYSATMLSDGTYVIGQASNFAKLNVATSPPTILSTGSLSGVNFTDFAVDPTDPTSLSGAKIYGINEGDGTNRLVILNVAGNNPTIVSQASNSTGFGDNAGSQFVDSFGTLYYRSSTNNSLYRIDSDSTSPNYGQATLISTTPGGGNTDGASCLFSAIMQKEVQDTAGNIITTSPANKVVKYVYSIASGNVQNLTGASFQDDLRTVASGNPINGTFTGTYTVSNGSGTVSFSNTNQTIQISNLVIPAQTQSTSGADKLTITAEVKVANTLTPGTYFNQSAIANLPSTYPSSIPSDYPLSPAYEDPTPLEVTAPIASDPKLLLVKRITAINPGQSDEIQFNNFMDDPGTTNDNNSKWPDSNIDYNDNINEYLRGVSNSSVVKPGDEVEYTIYFLSSGDTNAKEVKICDVVPDHMTFVKNTYGVELGIGLGFDPTALPTEPNLQLSNLLNDDQGEFYGSGTTPPANLCKKVSPANTLVNVNGTNNDNGAVVVELEDLPRAIEAGTPTNSYGFIRFRAKVK